MPNIGMTTVGSVAEAWVDLLAPHGSKRRRIDRALQARGDHIGPPQIDADADKGGKWNDGGRKKRQSAAAFVI